MSAAPRTLEEALRVIEEMRADVAFLFGDGDERREPAVFCGIRGQPGLALRLLWLRRNHTTSSARIADAIDAYRERHGRREPVDGSQQPRVSIRRLRAMLIKRGVVAAIETLGRGCEAEGYRLTPEGVRFVEREMASCRQSI